MGKGDRKTKKGKISMGSYGVRRPRSKNKKSYPAMADRPAKKSEEKAKKKEEPAASKETTAKKPAKKKTTAKKSTAKAKEDKK